MMLSVVIPSLGGESLESTIAALNAGTVIPDEILLCIPEKEAATLRSFAGPNVRVYRTAVRGQVAQRATGFAAAAHPLVLQLDDDLKVAPDCLERMREALLGLEGPGAVSPSLVDAATGKSVYARPARRGTVDAIHAFLLNGRRGVVPGSILWAGAAVGLDADDSQEKVVEVGWLPGGCVLHRREHLELRHYFPFSGKAYCEDIIHSHYLSARGVRMWVVPAARCAVGVTTAPLASRAFIRELTGDLRARRHFMRISGRAQVALVAFVASRLCGYAASRMR